MYDGWTSLLSDELLARAVRVDGILYLPAYGLAAEWFEMIFPYFFAFGVAIASGCFWWICCMLWSNGWYCVCVKENPRVNPWDFSILV